MRYIGVACNVLEYGRLAPRGNKDESIHLLLMSGFNLLEMIDGN